MERVRYPNPIPELPYAPKLVRVQQPEANYLSPVYAQRIAESQQLPVAVDAEAGMPIDLAKLEYLWLADGQQDPRVSEPLDWAGVDDEDAFLLSEDVAALPPAAVIGAPAQGPPVTQAQDVTWLRRTEYLGAEQRKLRQSERQAQATQLDTSHDAQVARIEQGFAAANAPLNTLKHPSNPALHAVDAYEVLPDPETWSTPMHVVRFAAGLGRGTADVQDRDVRMDTALLRPAGNASGQRVSLYLTSAEDLPAYDAEHTSESVEQSKPDADASRRQELAALRYAKRRRLGKYPPVPWLEGKGDTDSNEYATGFRHVRDLEAYDQTTALGNQLVLVLDDGKPDPAPELAHVTTSGTVAEQLAAQDDALFGDADASGEPDITTTLPPQSSAERAREQSVAPLDDGRKVAYYHKIDMRYGLRMRRQRKAEQGQAVPYEGFWHRVLVGNRAPTEKELAKRLHIRQHVDHLLMDGVEYASTDEDELLEVPEEDERDEKEPTPGLEPAPAPEAPDTEVAVQAAAEARDESEQGADSASEDGEVSDEDMSDASDIDAEAELAALRDEAGSDTADAPQGRRRRGPA